MNIGYWEDMRSAMSGDAEKGREERLTLGGSGGGGRGQVVVGVKQDSQAVADKPACLQELTLFFFLTLKSILARGRFHSVLNPY